MNKIEFRKTRQQVPCDQNHTNSVEVPTFQPQLNKVKNVLLDYELALVFDINL